ncbi:type VI secretion system tip protein VgrG [Enterobacter cancerogenus]|uniref:type VI secretion system Vgr family protein n=1 Tax=Enterobacter cancerogenus TaxID=69218 RepID=UPI000C771FED|nr:type VI secretion system Vgr family protein [Enterobacter cancerogenus]AUJ80479.1 type VI secretion system tip protein VgrG [Enterobacter cancerogenus]
MSLKNTLSETLTSSLNRYRLDIPSCTSPLDVEEFSGRECMSALYLYTIRFTSVDHDISAEQLLNKSATLSMGTGSLAAMTGMKVIHGTVTHFRRISGSADQSTYQILVEPFFALLGRQFRTHRFFVNKSVPEVVEQVLQEHGLHGWEYEFNLKQNYPKREQINQYQESDLTFIQRLLAEVGIFYWFTLQEDTQSEVVQFADAQRALMFGKTLQVNSPSGMSDSGTDSVWGLNVSHNVVEANVTTKDYNHRDAQSVLQSAPADMTRGDGEGMTYGEVYHYRLRHLERGNKIDPQAETANFYARLDHERFLADQVRITGKSTDVTLAPAQVLTLTDSLPPTLPEMLQGPLLLTAVGFTASRRDALQVTLLAVPYSETLCWRPPLLPRPKVTGTMTARVTSAKANDIYAWQDASGLYRVKFDADRDDKSQGQESMPVRLAKPYGGDVYGFHFPLIQGTEVAIAFHEGDPDRPYIAHALHDSRHVDHVTEKNSTRNVIRTPANNKLRMEDKRGEEHIKLSTEYGGKTQLNLGHNVDAGRTLRGEGFELRTDSWGAIRGGKGIFISADIQQSAEGVMLDMAAALNQLQQAQSLVESLSSAAETAKAELADMQIQKTLLSEALTELKKSALLLSAPAGIAQVTPKSLQLSAGENIIATSGGNTDFSIMKKLTVAVGERISLYAQKLGIKLFASKGKVEIQAQGDEMTLDALKDIRVSSSEGKIIISAKKEIILTSGGGYIRIADGTVECAAPDKIIERGAVWQKFGGQSISEAAQQWDSADFAITPEVRWPYDDAPIAGQLIRLVSEDGTEQKLTTSGSGSAPKQSGINAELLKAYLEDKD